MNLPWFSFLPTAWLWFWPQSIPKARCRGWHKRYTFSWASECPRKPVLCPVAWRDSSEQAAQNFWRWLVQGCWAINFLVFGKTWFGFFFLYKICGDLVVSKIYLLDIVHELDAQDESNIAPDSRGWWKSDLSPWALDTRIPPYKFSWCMFPSSLFLSTFLKPLFFMLLSHFVSLAAFTSPILSSVSVCYLDEIFPNR